MKCQLVEGGDQAGLIPGPVRRRCRVLGRRERGEPDAEVEAVGEVLMAPPTAAAGAAVPTGRPKEGSRTKG